MIRPGIEKITEIKKKVFFLRENLFAYGIKMGYQLRTGNITASW